jgi:hypothetical protein
VVNAGIVPDTFGTFERVSKRSTDAVPVAFFKSADWMPTVVGAGPSVLICRCE